MEDINITLVNVAPKDAADAHYADTSNPHEVTAAQVGLSNVNNTSDANKPVSTAQATAIAVVQSDINTHEARTDNPHSVTKSQVGLGSAENTADADKPISTLMQAALDLKQSILGLFASVMGLVLTGFSSGANTAVNNTDTLGGALAKFQGQINARATTSDLTSGLAAKTDKLITTNRQAASYTLALLDADLLVEMNVAGANNLTVPPNSTITFPIGTQILLAQYGAGQTTVVPDSGVTVNSSGGKLKLAARYSGATLIKIATNEWYLFGDITT